MRPATSARIVTALALVASAATTALTPAAAAGGTKSSHPSVRTGADRASPPRDAGIVQVPGSPVRVSTWQEADGEAGVTHAYAISLDGRSWSAVRRTSYELLLRYDRFDPLEREPRVDRVLALRSPDDPPPPDDAPDLYLVQFLTQPLEAYRDALRDLGAVVYDHVPRHAHLVLMTPPAAAEAAAMPFVRWIGPYEPAYRMEDALLELVAAPAPDATPRRCNVMVLEPAHKDVVADRIAALGGVVDRADAGKVLLEATLTPAQLLEVVRWPQVLYVDRWSPFEADMDIARDVSGADLVESVAGYTGQGVRGEVLDTGFNVAHVDFQAMPLILHTAVVDDSHGASTSGIIFGDGTGNAMARGLLPDGQGIVAQADTLLTGQSRYDHTAELLGAPYFAVFQSASVGNDRTTQYSTISADHDALLFDFDIVHCQSQSNAGDNDSRPQAWAKNVVAVGGIRHQDTATRGDDCWGCDSTAASIGPAEDGRIKPDLCNFYDNIFTVTTPDPTSYRPDFGGTSAATPITAGQFGVMFQMWSDGLFGNATTPTGTVFENRPHMATAKALMINTADQYDFTGTGHDLTRTHQGWGMASLSSLYALRDRMLIVDETDLLANLEAITYAVDVAPGEPAARFTLVYTDPPGLPATTQHRVNDLSLRVTSPDGAVYWGNNGLLTGNWSVPGGGPNQVDTVENVLVENPAAGLWTVEVIADEINQDSHVETPQVDADFALVVSGVQLASPALAVELPDGVPSLVPPVTPADIAVRIADGAESLVAGSGTLHYRFDPGEPFAEASLTPLGGESFTATLPPAPCGSTPQLYVSAEGDGGAVVTNPPNAPGSFYAAEVGVLVTLMADDFETDQGWTVQNDAALTDGQWERGVPLTSCERGNPVADGDGSGSCYLTDNDAANSCNSDVDGGPSWLISPAIDLSGVDAEVSFALWYTNNYGTFESNADVLNVHVSNDDGVNWTLALSFGPVSAQGWFTHAFDVADAVAPTSQVRVRFEVSDLAGGSIVEAGIDGFRVQRVECLAPCLADADGSGAVDVTDLLGLLAAWGSSSPLYDVAPAGGDGVVDTVDLLFLLASWGACP